MVGKKEGLAVGISVGKDVVGKKEGRAVGITEGLAVGIGVGMVMRCHDNSLLTWPKQKCKN